MHDTSVDQRPPIWVGHIHLATERLEESEVFMRAIGMRPIAKGEDYAVLELRGGTHLVLSQARAVAPGTAAFDLMVDDLEAARAEWAGRSMSQVDNAMVRYRIERGDEAEFWVVGGRYKTTEFRIIADGDAEERHGPFTDYDDAMKEWQARSMAEIDDAHVRYRIEQA